MTAARVRLHDAQLARFGSIPYRTRIRTRSSVTAHVVRSYQGHSIVRRRTQAYRGRKVAQRRLVLCANLDQRAQLTYQTSGTVFDGRTGTRFVRQEVGVSVGDQTTLGQLDLALALPDAIDGQYALPGVGQLGAVGIQFRLVDLQLSLEVFRICEDNQNVYVLFFIYFELDADEKLHRCKKPV